MSISTGVERDGQAISRTVTRATPGSEDLIDVFGERIGPEAIILCDGATGYNALGAECDCDVKNVKEETGSSKGGKGFYNINTVNNFHSFIKEWYTHCRGVATKYLNRYNILFAKAFRGAKELVDDIYNMLCSNDVNHWHGIDAVKGLNLLDI